MHGIPHPSAESHSTQEGQPAAPHHPGAGEASPSSPRTAGWVSLQASLAGLQERFARSVDGGTEQPDTHGEDPESHSRETPALAPGVVAAQKAYDTTLNALKTAGKYSSDAHYLVGNVELVQDDGTVVQGRFRLSDYFASSCTDFTYGADGYDSDPAEQSRLLANHNTVVNAQLYDADGRLQQLSYAFMRPSALHPGSTMGWFFHGSDVEDPVLQLPEDWPADCPAIKRGEGPSEELNTIVTNPDSDAQLAKLLEALRPYCP